MSSRTLLALLGFGIAVTGIVAARSGFDPFLSLAMVVVGGFLLILPFTRTREDE